MYFSASAHLPRTVAWKRRYKAPTVFYLRTATVCTLYNADTLDNFFTGILTKNRNFFIEKWIIGWLLRSCPAAREPQLHWVNVPDGPVGLPHLTSGQEIHGHVRDQQGHRGQKKIGEKKEKGEKEGKREKKEKGEKKETGEKGRNLHEVGKG